MNAVADMYRGSTTLTLAATSLHPQRAGVQKGLLQVLLDHGAAIDHPATGGGRSIVHSCLANGRPEAAEYLARRGASLDFESAAALDRLEIVSTYFTGEKPSVTDAQQATALVAASINGATAVVEFLLDRGVHVDAQANGFSGVTRRPPAGARKLSACFSRVARHSRSKTRTAAPLSTARCGERSTRPNRETTSP